MAQSFRAPKQWCLSKHETITSFEKWRRNTHYVLSLDPNQTEFLKKGFTWKRKRVDTNRGFTDDAEGTTNKRTKEQKTTHLELMLGQVANYCTVIADKFIIDESTSIDSVWNAIRLHYGLQANGGRFLDLCDIRLEPEERPEDLYQRLVAFFDDNLLKQGGTLKHHDETIEEDETLGPSLENCIVVMWLRLVHNDLPGMVKTKFATELRSRTVASLRPEISMALDSMLDDVHSKQEFKVMRSSIESHRKSFDSHRKGGYKSFPGQKGVRFQDGRAHKKPYVPKKPYCAMCDSHGRPNNHHLMDCRWIPSDDREYISRKHAAARNIGVDEEEYDDEYSSDGDSVTSAHYIRHNDDDTLSRRIQVEQSPYLDTYYRHCPLRITVDSGATGNFIGQSTAKRLRLHVRKSTQSANQADGSSKLKVMGEISITVVRGCHDLKFEALVVESLDVEALGGTTFQSMNDIYPRPNRKIVYVGDDEFPYSHDDDSGLKCNRVRAHVLRSNIRTTVWPSEYVELSLPEDMPDSSYAIEPRWSSVLNRSVGIYDMWPPPEVTCTVGGKIRISNDTNQPIVLNKHDQFCQVRSVITPDPAEKFSSKSNSVKKNADFTYFTDVKLDPENNMNDTIKQKFIDQLERYNHVFSPDLPGYNGASGNVKAVINMGPVQPPQRKGKLPLYSRNNMEVLQQKCDELEAMGVFCKPEDVNVNVEYVNPSFLVRKPHKDDFRLVTAFSDVGRYAKPQPSLMPNVDATIRQVGQWKYIIASDLTKAYHQTEVRKVWERGNAVPRHISLSAGTFFKILQDFFS